MGYRYQYFKITVEYRWLRLLYNITDLTDFFSFYSPTDLILVSLFQVRAAWGRLGNGYAALHEHNCPGQ